MERACCPENNLLIDHVIIYIQNIRRTCCPHDNNLLYLYGVKQQGRNASGRVVVHGLR
jgi:hypothetical protein